VPLEEFRASQAQTQQTLAALNETMSALREGISAASSRPQYVMPPQTQGRALTRGQWIEAVQTGNEEVIAAYEEQQKQALLAEHVHPLRDNGLEAIANLTRNTTVGQLPYYQRFKKEIDGFIQNLPAGMRMSAEVYQTAHEVVVGRHAAELIQEAKEAALRGDPAPAEPADAGRRSVRAGGGGGGTARDHPSVEDLGGRDAMDALAGAGKDPDAMAQRMGYANWKDYMTKTRDYQAVR
jgi:hypothetical protein